MGEDQDCLHPLLIGIGHRRRVQRAEVTLDGGVPLVEHVVHAPGFGDLPVVVGVQGRTGADQHGIQHVGEAQSLPHGRADRDGWHRPHRAMEIQRLGRIRLIDPGWESPAQQGGVEPEEREEHGGQSEIEQRMEIRDSAGIVRHDLDHPHPDIGQRHQGQTPAQCSVDQIAEREALGGRRRRSHPPAPG